MIIWRAMIVEDQTWEMMLLKRRVRSSMNAKGGQESE